MFRCTIKIDLCCHRRRPRSIITEPLAPESEPEAEWDIISVVSSPRGAADSDSSAEEPVEVREPTAAELLDTSVRWYAVWKYCSSGIQWPGIHFGKDKAAYAGLIQLNGGSFGGLKWKRVSSHSEARAKFLAEAPKYGVTTEHVNYYAWKCPQ